MLSDRWGQYLQQLSAEIVQPPWQVEVAPEAYDRGWFLRARTEDQDVPEFFVPAQVIYGNQEDLITHLLNDLEKRGVPVNERRDIDELEKPRRLSY